MTEETILDKIKKLLALGNNNSNVHEAELAISRARELMIRYNLSVESLAENGFEKYTKETVDKHFFNFELMYLRDIIEKFFFCKTLKIHKTDTLHIIGTKENVALGIYMLHHISRKFQQCFDEHKKNAMGKKIYRKSYYSGLWQGLCEKLKADEIRLAVNENLIVVKDPKVQEFFNMQFNPSTVRKTGLTKPRQDWESIDAGIKAGKNIQLNPGINSNNTQKTLRLGN